MMDIIKTKHGNCDNFTYKGLIAMQVYGVDTAFTELALWSLDNPFKTIIELGADYGGLTNMLADHPICNHAMIHTFDLNNDRFRNLNPEKIIFYHADIYQNLDYIGDLIRTSGRTLILCDGGNKPLEFNTLSTYMKVGDVIMAHDYAPDKDAHNDNVEHGRWDWWEFNDSAIENKTLIKSVNFFDSYAWCFREKTYDS